MPTNSASKETALKLRQLLFDEFGKRIYGDQNPHNISRRYLLTDAKLRDMLNTGAARTSTEELLPHLKNGSGKVHDALSETQLLRYIKLARLGRCILRKREFDPDFFASEESITIAKRLIADRLPVAA